MTEKDKSQIKVIKAPKLQDYASAERFAVVRKLPKNKRYYCNFRILYTDRALAEAEALRLAKEQGGKFYVIEIVGVTK